MNNVPLINETRKIGKPANWDEEKQGVCRTISVHDQNVDGVNYMMTCWKPNELERILMNKGAPLVLGISGNVHPVIMLFVDEDNVDKVYKHKPFDLDSVALNCLFNLREIMKVQYTHVAQRDARIQIAIRQEIAKALGLEA